MFWLLVAVILAQTLLAFSMGRVHASRPLRAALRRAQARMRYAKWCIYRDWAEADSTLGIAERDVARVLEESRIDVKPDMTNPSVEELEMFIQAHQNEFEYPITHRH